MPLNKSSYKVILSLAISAAVLLLLSQAINIKDIKILFNASWGWLILGLITFALNYFLRSLRFRALLDVTNIPHKDIYGITAVYGMLNFLMPSKSGEFSYPLLIKRYLGISLTHSTASLITARFFDFATIAIFLPAILVAFRDRLPTWALYSAAAFFIFIASSSLFFLLYLRRPHPRINEPPSPHSSRLQHHWHNLVLALKSIYRNGCYFRVLALTFGIWITIYINFYCIATGLGIDVTLLQMVIVSIILVPLTLIPLQGVANLGAHEIGWTTALTLFGYDAKSALTIAVGSHVILFIFVLILGASGFMLLRKTSRYAP